MDKISDETLMAYADDELTPAERGEVEAAIAASPELRSRLLVFERTKSGLSGLYNEPMRRPVPDRLIDAALGVAGGSEIQARQSRPGLGAASAFENMLAILLQREHMAFAIPTIVGLLVFAAGLSGWHLRSIVGQPTAADQSPLVVLEQGRVVAHGLLQQALETAPSGHSFALPERRQGNLPKTDARTAVKPQITFRTTDKRICRQYLLTNAQEQQFTGVACRGAKGTWQVQIHVAAARRPVPTGNFAPAAGRVSALVDKHIDQLIDGDALRREEEQSLLDSWKAN